MNRAISTVLAGMLVLSFAVAPLPALGEAGRFQTFKLPSGDYPHDVSPGPDGTIYYADQRRGALGIVDPKTGNVEKVALGEDSSPHGVITGPGDTAWLTDGGQNAIVRVDPRTRAVKAWPLPEGTGYANLNTAIFDGKGVHWFTGQSGIYGRLDPASGEMKVFEAPKGRGPYGIHATPDGTVFYASLAGSYIGEIDSTTGTAKVIEPPTPRQGARRVWSDSTGNIWVAEWNSGNLSRYEPKTGKWSKWQAPGDAPRVYAVYVDETDKVWAAEWSAQVMLRFDPTTEKFESFKSSSSRPNVRQIHGRKGEVWTPESGADKIVVYRYK